ncbi:hypothetical protein PJF56_02910 [Roseofilum sp. BLCC_M91]|uniref:IS607 family transposase n=1 Tax=Roseofilum halophilum BLCC-M91 TaxID=3022259 RepID=A0ABT7BF57_9CYAN|nr:hypothetical protein [Roseofilum halophilum]MDJ1177808.1 hypothetical protein [Roseofilum halophilum BLCC-M91]
MKLSDYAKKAGVSYQTAWRWWQKGHLSGSQLPYSAKRCILVVEHKDRLARLGKNYLEILLKEMKKTVEIVNHSEDKQYELMEYLIAIITSFCSRLYGLRRSKRKTEKIIAELKERS